MHLPNRGFHQENLAFSPSCISHNMDYRQKMVVASNQTHVVDDDDDDDLEALRRAALQTLRAKDNIPKKVQPIPQRQTINYQLSQPRIFYKGISPVKRDFYQPKPQCQNGNLHFQTHCLNPNLITIVPVEESVSEPVVVPPPSQPASQPSDVSDVSVKSELSDDSKFCRYKDDASGSEEDDEERRSANVLKVKAEVKNEKEGTELVEEASEPEVESTQASPQRSEDDEDEEEEEEDDDDVLIMADLEEEDSLERLMDEMEREMNVDKPSDKKEKRHGKKDSKLSRKADAGVGQKEKTKKADEKKANVGSTPTISASSICTNLKTEQRASSPYNPNKPVHRRRSLSPKMRLRRKSPRRSPRRSPLRSSKKCQRDGTREAVRYRSPRKSPTRFSPRPRSPRLSPRLRSPRGSPRRSPNRSPRRSPLRSPPRMRSPRLSPRLRSPRPQRSPRVSPHPRSPRLPRSRSPRLSPRPRSPRMRSRSPRLSPRRSPTRMSPRTRSPKLSPRPRSPRLSPRRPSPRLRSPRISPRRLSPRSRSPRLSPRRISPRTRSPRISPRRLSPRARSPRMSPRRMSPRLRSPRLSPHRSPWSSPRNSPRLSPRRRRSPKELSRKIRPRSITPDRASSPPLKKRFSPNSKLRASPDTLKCKAVPKKDEAYEISDSGKDQDNTNADPILEARRRKFESTKPIDPINANKKIKLSKKEYHTNKKTEDPEPAVVNFPKLDEPIEDYQEEETESYIEADFEFEDLEEVEEESPAATIASAVNVCSEIEPAKLEREKPLKKKKKKDKELYNVHKIKSELPLSERIGKEKKCKQRKDIPSDGPSEKSEVVFEDVTVEDEEGDLRTELSRRRAERLNRAAPTHQQSVRLVQSAFKGVVSEVVKNSARTVRKQLVKGEEKSSQKEVRRVTVLHRPVTDLHESEDETPLDSKVPIRFRLGLNKVMQDTRDPKASRKSSKRQNRKVKHKTNLSSTDVKNPR